MSVEIPGYIAGTWAIDPVHSEVSFVVRHMKVSKVRGRFDKFEGTDWSGTIETAMTETVENEWTVEITVPSNYTKTVNFLFRNEGMTIWDNFNDPVHWGAFIAQPGE